MQNLYTLDISNLANDAVVETPCCGAISNLDVEMARKYIREMEKYYSYVRTCRSCGCKYIVVNPTPLEKMVARVNLEANI